MDQSDGHRVQEVQLLPPRALGDDEVRVFENAQVLHHPETGHVQLGLELGQRAAVTREEPVEQEAPRRIGGALNTRSSSVTFPTIRDQMVTCQAAVGFVVLSVAVIAVIAIFLRSHSYRCLVAIREIQALDCRTTSFQPCFTKGGT